MYDALFVHCGKSLKQRPKVYLDFIVAHRMIEGLVAISYRTAQGTMIIRYPEILMTKMWQHGYNLVLMPASGDQRADSFASSQVM